MADDIKERVVAIIAAQAVIEPAEVAMDQSPEALGIESLGMVEAIFAIEEEFDISVPFDAGNPDENEVDLSTVAAIVRAVETLVADAAG